MKIAHLEQKASAYLHTLCVEVGGRQVGAQGNRDATDFFAAALAALGFEIQTPAFDCMAWRAGSARLEVGGAVFTAEPSPYSLGCRVLAPLVVVSTVDELEQADAQQILLLRGAIAQEQLMPKNFPFYNPAHHQHIIRLLETKQPAAIITATARDAAMAGGLYPFPLIEDGDFDIPSVYLTDEVGERLAQYAGQPLLLASQAERMAARGCNVIARRGADQARRVVVCAHIDAKMGTPGALDNGGGVVTLLLLGELLADYAGSLGLEIVAINGEDYYSSPGEQLYLAMNAGRFDTIALNINLDGVGYREGKDAYSLYECPDETAVTIHNVFSIAGDLVAGEPWFQGDHAIFVMQGVPALAITSERVAELLATIVHTADDVPELVAARKLARLAGALRDLILALH